MTAYTKSTNFATKDTLTSGDPLKIVKGTEINTEFDNIATAVNSKSDTASPTFTGTVTAAALTTTGNTILGDASTDTLNVGNGGLVKDASGNVGIGTTSPSTYGAKLAVYSATSSVANIQITNPGQGTGTIGIAAASSNFKIYNSYTSATLASGVGIDIDTSGNVGIGTSTPSSYGKVASVSGSAFGSSFTAISNSSGTDWARMDWKHQAVASTCLIYLDQTGLFNIRNDGANPIAFYTNGGNERMRIDSSGNLLVGCTVVPNVGVSGQYGTSSSTNEVVISKNTTGTTPALYIRTSAGASKTPISFYNDASQVGSITTSTTATAYNTSSDYRLKEDIAPMSGALAKVAALKPVTYKWKSDGSDGEGFIAHELAEVCPHAITGEKDAVETYTDENGNKQTRPKYQGIDTSFLVATLTAALQEQQALITALTARITALENK